MVLQHHLSLPPFMNLQIHLLSYPMKVCIPAALAHTSLVVSCNDCRQRGNPVHKSVLLNEMAQIENKTQGCPCKGNPQMEHLSLLLPNTKLNSMPLPDDNTQNLALIVDALCLGATQARAQLPSQNTVFETNPLTNPHINLRHLLHLSNINDIFIIRCPPI
jgi:hypothetical protein